MERLAKYESDPVFLKKREDLTKEEVEWKKTLNMRIGSLKCYHVTGISRQQKLNKYHNDEKYRTMCLDYAKTRYEMKKLLPL